MTQEYLGVKQVTAWEEEKDGQPGYAIKYPDGYRSWSPKAVFEEAYLPLGHISHLPAHEQRMIGEYAYLSKLTAGAYAFLDKIHAGEAPIQAGSIEHRNLKVQAGYMRQYQGALYDRIDLLTFRGFSTPGIELKNGSLNLMAIGQQSGEAEFDLTDTFGKIVVTDVTTPEGYPIRAKIQHLKSEFQHHAGIQIDIGTEQFRLLFDRERCTLNIAATSNTALKVFLSIELVNHNRRKLVQEPA